MRTRIEIVLKVEKVILNCMNLVVLIENTFHTLSSHMGSIFSHFLLFYYFSLVVTFRCILLRVTSFTLYHAILIYWHNFLLILLSTYFFWVDNQSKIIFLYTKIENRDKVCVRSNLFRPYLYNYTELDINL